MQLFFKKYLSHFLQLNQKNDASVSNNLLSKDQRPTMNLIVLNSDVICLLTRQLPVNSLTNLLQANKTLFEQRKVYLSCNLILQEFSLFANVSYFNVLYNSHVEEVKDWCPIIKFCIDLPVNPTMVSNTLTLISYGVKPNDAQSEARCGTVLSRYIQQLLYEKYDASMSANVKNEFMSTVLKCEWWQCKINFYEIYEIIYLTRKRKYRAVEKCLSEVHFGNTDSFASFYIGLRMIMDCIMMQYFGKSKAVMTYLLYAYLHKAFHHVAGMKRSFIDAVILKCDEFIYSIRKISTLPKYLKKLIIEKIEQVHANLLQI